MSMEINIEQLKTFSPDILVSVNNLLRQLNPDLETLTDEAMRDIIGNQSNYLLVARESDNNKIVGMLTVAVCSLPEGEKAWIEDLVVDSQYRGKGIATKLIDCAIEKAKTNGVKSVNLTSRPEKEAANKLYVKLSFEKRDTNVYRKDL
jgi:ribosomal protein S18 acetylase RimI-like enzyme